MRVLLVISMNLFLVVLISTSAIPTQAEAQSTPIDWLFNQKDINGDGRISEDEMGRPQLFAKLDIDSSGSVSTEETLAYYRQRRDVNADALVPIEYNGTVLSSHNPLADLRYTADYIPGSWDESGNFSGGTEVMRLTAHRGMLFATLGYWMDVPYLQDKAGDPWTGAQVIVKETAGSNWRVDLSPGPTYIRIEALESLTLTTDGSGQSMKQPVELLVAGAGDNNPVEKQAAAWIRNDKNGTWTRSLIASMERKAGVRSLGVHLDPLTGVHYVFAGLSGGEIYRGVYKPDSMKLLEWVDEPELTGTGRVMGFAECNGELYASCGLVEDQTGKLSGGLFRRHDGIQPHWELVYQWPYTPVKRGDEPNIMRGITAVPATDDSGNEVIIGTLSGPGHVVRIDPTQKYAVTVELDARKYFASIWGLDEYRGPCLMAYNNLVPFSVPMTGENVHLIGIWVNRNKPSDPEPRDAYYLVRHADGSYGHGTVSLQGEPAAGTKGIESVRTIEPSPFAGEEGRVLYFGGYDCARRDSHNSAWLYRSELSSFENVVLISWDGLDRSVVIELLESGRLPNLQRIVDSGTFQPIEIKDHATMTKTSHTVMLTGYKPHITGVVTNRDFEPIPAGLSIFERVQDALGGADAIATMFVASKVANVGGRGPDEAKAWLASKQKTDHRRNESGAGVTAGADDTDLSLIEAVGGEPFYLTRQCLDVFDSEQRKANETGDLCLQYLSQHRKPRLLAFFHFSDPDTAGHKYGMDSEEYRLAAVLCDKWLGEILNKLQEVNLANNTLVYITTDHGFDKHVSNAKSHNYAPDCWLVANDISINRGGEIADIAATVLYRFGVNQGQLNPPLAGEPLMDR